MVRYSRCTYLLGKDCLDSVPVSCATRANITLCRLPNLGMIAHRQLPKNPTDTFFSRYPHLAKQCLFASWFLLSKHRQVKDIALSKDGTSQYSWQACFASKYTALTSYKFKGYGHRPTITSPLLSDPFSIFTLPQARMLLQPEMLIHVAVQRLRKAQPVIAPKTCNASCPFPRQSQNAACPG
jgi:hypothetical protein